MTFAVPALSRCGGFEQVERRFFFEGFLVHSYMLVYLQIQLQKKSMDFFLLN